MPLHENDKRGHKLAARREKLFAEYRIEVNDGVVFRDGRVVYRGDTRRAGLKFAHGLIHRLKNPKQALERSRRQMAAQDERRAAARAAAEAKKQAADAQEQKA